MVRRRANPAKGARTNDDLHAIPRRPTPPSTVGSPLFPDGAAAGPAAIADPARWPRRSSKILGSGMLTNGRYVRELERRAAEYLGVGECVAVAPAPPA